MPRPQHQWRPNIAELLRQEVAAMPLDNFLVRPKRRFVEKYATEDAWKQVGLPEQAELLREVAGLPSATADPDLEAKLFDLLILRLQLARLRSETTFTGLRKRVEEIANLLSEMDSIPMVREQMPLIQSLLSKLLAGSDAPRNRERPQEATATH